MSMVPRLRRLLRSKARITASRAVMLVAAVAVLVTFVRAGTRFFYCPVTHLTYDALLCSPGHDDTPDTSGPAIQTPDCCQVKWRPAAPNASAERVERPSVGRADLAVSFSLPQLDIARDSARLPFGISRFVRAGPAPPSAVERRAQLMVFHL
jgi:hypothetical protein